MRSKRLYLKGYFIKNLNKIDKLTLNPSSPDAKLATTNNIEYYIQNIRDSIGEIKKRSVAPTISLELQNELSTYLIFVENIFSIANKTQAANLQHYIDLSDSILSENKLNSNLREALSSCLTVLEEFFHYTSSKEKDLVDNAKKKITKIKDAFSIRILGINVIRLTKKTDKPFNLTHLYYIMIVVLCNNIWRTKLENKTLKSDDITEKLYDYIVYKTLSIASKYDDYDNFKDIFEEKDFLTDNNLVENLATKLQALIDKIYKDVEGEKTHITLKIRQAVNFLDHPYSTIDSEKKDIDISTFCSQINSNLKDGNDIYDFFFPAIFSSDVILEQFNTQEDINNLKLREKNELYVTIDVEKKVGLTQLSQLSSGERQQLNTVGAVIYHLRNINSVSSETNSLVKYKYVNLIFEEIELYFHPEFQRTFIHFLLFHLSKATLNSIDNLNISFVTHSPFILSDIPQQNILALDKGFVKNIPFNTLGANIHEMLGHNFLLNNTIGEIVKLKIDDFIKVYTDYHQHKDKKTKYSYSAFINKKDDFQFLIENMGEGYLKNILESYYSEILQDAKGKGKIKASKIEIEKQIEKKIQELKDLRSEKNNL